MMRRQGDGEGLSIMHHLHHAPYSSGALRQWVFSFDRRHIGQHGPAERTGARVLETKLAGVLADFSVTAGDIGVQSYGRQRRGCLVVPVKTPVVTGPRASPHFSTGYIDSEVSSWHLWYRRECHRGRVCQPSNPSVAAATSPSPPLSPLPPASPTPSSPDTTTAAASPIRGPTTSTRCQPGHDAGVQA